MNRSFFKSRDVTERKVEQKKNFTEIKTFPVPFPLEEIKDNIIVNTTKPSQTHKEELIKQALKFHSEGNISEAAKYYQYFINKGLKDYRVFSNYGVILLDIGKFRKAEILTRKAIELKPDFPDAHANLGIILKDLGKLKEAELSQRKAIELKPNFANAHSNLGIILRGLGKSKEAELSHRKAIELNPNFADAYSNLAIILKDLGKLKEAELSQQKAIQINPNLAISHYNLGNILKDLDKLKEAELSHRKAIELNPDFADAHSNLGSILKDLGKFNEAESSHRKAIQINPNLAISHYNLGNILKNLGKLKEAELSHRKAIELNPDFANAHTNLGTILEEIGKREEAIKYLIKAVELEPEKVIAMKNLVMFLCFNNKYELALKYLQKNKSEECQSLYLGCLLSLDREQEFYKKYNELSNRKICNADIGGIVEHANIIYQRKIHSPFCNESIKYVLCEKINEDAFSENDLNQLISFIKKDRTNMRAQKTLHGGVQTSGNLFSLDYPYIKSVQKALEEKIESYKNKFKDSNQGFINNWPKHYELRSWMISMKKGGFLKPHNHEYGWITGSFYLKVPKRSENDNAGCIAFSYQGPRYPNKNKNFNLTIQTIEARDICIFPSSLFHQTIPFHSKEERICFVFDLIQKT